jgi:undecaprenyl-phosphate 4-deoxy-4-formamido-L-arabinose transferase
VNEATPAPVHTVSVVIPVYQGERTLPHVIDEVARSFTSAVTPGGHQFVVDEVLLVYDNGPDRSAQVIRDLSAAIEQVRPVWLSRNYGQHAATLAGMASTGGDWIVTLDEDGQHDPRYIGDMLDVAMREQAGVVYALPVNPPPHGLFRNVASKGAKWLMRRLAKDQDISSFQSYRLVLGETGRSVAAYAGTGVYLDIALTWVNGRISQCPVELRQEGDRPSGYSTRTLLSHFWRLVLTSGTRALRAVSLLGATFGLLGVLLAVYTIGGSLLGRVQQPGWASTVVLISIGTGAILFFLGIIAEYLGVIVNMAMGRPLYLISHDPQDGPLGRQHAVGAGSSDDER